MGDLDYINFDAVENGNKSTKYSPSSRLLICKPISTQLLPKIFVFVFLVDIAMACWFLARLTVLENGYEASVLNLTFYSL